MCEEREFVDIDLPYKRVVVAVGKKSSCSFQASYFILLSGPLPSPNLDLVCERWALLAEKSSAISLLLSTCGSKLHCGTFLPCDQVLLRGDPDPIARSMQSWQGWAWLPYCRQRKWNCRANVVGGETVWESLWTQIRIRKWTNRSEWEKKHWQMCLSVLVGHREVEEGNLGLTSIVPTRWKFNEKCLGGTAVILRHVTDRANFGLCFLFMGIRNLMRHGFFPFSITCFNYLVF